MLNLPKRIIAQPSKQYASLGLSDLPFPSEPVVVPDSPDPRRNGTIYALEPVKEAIKQFEDLLIRPHDFENRVKLASLWSKGDAESGRGMGKTALLRFFQQRINNDWGTTQFDGQFSAVVLYVSFPNQVDRRYMEQLAWSALVDACRNGVLDASRAALRSYSLSGQQIDAIVNIGGTQNNANLLNNDILEANGVSPSKLDADVREQLKQGGVQPATADALSRGQFESYLRSLRRDGNLVPLYVPRQTKGLDYSREFLFNDLVNYLRLAGFAGGYLFVDDIENLVDQMTRRQRLEFAKEFGLCTVRPGYANTAHSFFSCVLTTHQSSSLPLSQAWNEAGLSSMARLDPSAPTSVELPPPTQDQAQDIIIAHLDYYRTSEAKKGTIEPFTKEGIDELVGYSPHPRQLLSRAAHVVLYAADRKLTSIDAQTVKEATDDTMSPPTFDVTEGLDDAL